MLTPPVYRAARAVIVAVARLVWRLDVRGLEHVPPRDPVIVAGNHLSFIDSVVIPLAVPRPVTFLAKEEYFTGRGPRGRAVALFFRAIGAVPVRRGGSRDALDALELARGILGAGGAFGIYPEGTRSRDGRLYRGRTGVAFLALATGAPVVPVALNGTDRVQPIGAAFPRAHRVTVRFGPAIDPGELAGRVASGATTPGRARRELTDQVMDAIAAMSGQERCGDYNAHAAEEPAGT